MCELNQQLKALGATREEISLFGEISAAVAWSQVPDRIRKLFRGARTFRGASLVQGAPVNVLEYGRLEVVTVEDEVTTVNVMIEG
jgi:hypothetical protein